jgi:hypothetical protein
MRDAGCFPVIEVQHPHGRSVWRTKPAASNTTFMRSDGVKKCPKCIAS